MLVNNHDPRHLREEFEADHPGGYGWDYLERGPAAWRIRISRLAATSLPRVLADTRQFAADGEAPDAAGAVWKLGMRQRDLDSNVIRLQPGATIDSHVGPDLDVIVLVLSGDGQVGTELGPVDLRAGALAWLPRRSRRQISAGAQGLTSSPCTSGAKRWYSTRRPALSGHRSAGLTERETGRPAGRGFAVESASRPPAGQPRSFNPVADTISALAAEDATDRWVMTFALLGLGACYITTALALRPAAAPGRLILTIGGAATGRDP